MFARCLQDVKSSTANTLHRLRVGLFIFSEILRKICENWKRSFPIAGSLHHYSSLTSYSFMNDLQQ